MQVCGCVRSHSLGVAQRTGCEVGGFEKRGICELKYHLLCRGMSPIIDVQLREKYAGYYVDQINTLRIIEYFSYKEHITLHRVLGKHLMRRKQKLLFVQQK